MRQFTVISGKGGTGKTSITAAFASLTEGNAVFADCDVDAADLHLILKPRVKKTMVFHGLKIASIDKKKCISCKKCYEHCRFNAIDEEINLVKERCEGCGVCAYICPVNAVSMVDRDSGFLYVSETRFGPMVHALLNTGEEASGKLVTMVREKAKVVAEEGNKDLVIIDGPPGIGCPLISSITGVDLALVVTEPTLSAIHDLERLLDVTEHFKVPAVVCVNKYDINVENTRRIGEYCRRNNIPIVGRLPYDTVVTKAMIHEKTVIEFTREGFSDKLNSVWKKIIEVLV